MKVLLASAPAAGQAAASVVGRLRCRDRASTSRDARCSTRLRDGMEAGRRPPARAQANRYSNRSGCHASRAGSVGCSTSVASHSRSRCASAASFAASRAGSGDAVGRGSALVDVFEQRVAVHRAARPPHPPAARRRRARRSAASASAAGFGTATAYSCRYAGQWSAARRSCRGRCRRRGLRQHLAPAPAEGKPQVERQRACRRSASGSGAAPRSFRAAAPARTARPRRLPGWKRSNCVALGADARQHRRPGIVAAELAELPLLGQHPQRVAHLGLQRAVEVVRARPSLEAVPARHRRHRAAPSAARRVRIPCLQSPWSRVLELRQHGHVAQQVVGDGDLRERVGRVRRRQEPAVGRRRRGGPARSRAGVPRPACRSPHRAARPSSRRRPSPPGAPAASTGAARSSAGRSGRRRRWSRSSRGITSFHSSTSSPAIGCAASNPAGKCAV